MSKKEIENNKKVHNNNSKTIKIGLITQNSPFINATELFNSFFEKSKPSYYKIKSQSSFEFSLLSIPELFISIYHLTKIDEIHDKTIYNLYNFFLIFIDIQNISTDSFLDKILDNIIEVDDNNFNKKCYIYGFYQNNGEEKMTEEKITNILESKGIEYYYNEIIFDDIESFSKLIECSISDCNSIIVEKFLAQKHSELITDNSFSHCVIY